MNSIARVILQSVLMLSLVPSANAQTAGAIDPLYEHPCNVIVDKQLAAASLAEQRRVLHEMDAPYRKGMELLAAGRAQDALAAFLAYIDNIGKYVAPTHHLYTDALQRVVLARTDLRDFTQAVVDARTIYETRLTCLGPDDKFTLEALTSLVKLYSSIGQWGIALELAESIADSLQRNIATMPEKARSADVRKRVVVAQWNVAGLAFRNGDVRRASVGAEATIKAAETLPGDDLEGYELTNSAWYLLNRVANATDPVPAGAVARTIKGLESSYSSLRSLLGRDHPRTFPALANVGFATADADPQRGFQILGDYVALVERERVRSTRPSDRQLFLEGSGGAYQRFTFAAAQAGRPLDAFYGIEWSKARSLRDAFSTRLALVNGGLRPADVDALNAAERRISDLEADIESTMVDLQRRQALAAQLSQAKTRYAELFDEAVKRYPQFARAAQSVIQFPTNASTLLKPDEVFVSYLTRRLEGPVLEVLVAVLEPSSKLTVYTLAAGVGLESTAAVYADVLSRSDGLTGFARSGQELWHFRGAFFPAAPDADLQGAEIVTSFEKLRAAVSEQLLPQPVRETLGRYKRWIVSPSGPIWNVPFETLTDGSGLVVDTHVVRYVHSWTMLTMLSDAHRAQVSVTGRVPLVAIGGAKYSDSKEWSDLPYSASELDLVNDHFRLANGTGMFRGSAATRETIRRLDGQGSLARARMILLSTHGHLDLVNPARSALVFGRSMTGDESDRYLTAREISGFSLRADLVVVSGCDSGQGRFAAGEGLLGLPYSFFAAGATSAVVTRWGVYDDPATAELVRDLLVAVDGGQDVAAALTDIKRRLKKTKSEAHWAAFILLGR